MTVEIRSIREEEVQEWTDAMHLGFLQEAAAPGAGEARLEYIDPERTLGAFDATEHALVGTFRSFPTHFTVPGGEGIEASAITNVTVRPTHRRRGILRSMMTRDLRASRDRDEPLAILIASEYPIYGRYGFGPATEHAGYEIDAAGAAFREAAPGSVAIVTGDLLRPDAVAIYERFRRAQPASITRQPLQWDLSLGLRDLPGRPRWKGRCALYRDASGVAQGYLRYRIEESWDQRVPRNKLIVEELVAVTRDAYARLWRFCVEMDWITQVKAEDRSVEELLPWLLVDARAVRQTQRADMVWLRLLDVPAALSARTYARSGRLTIEVVDDAGLSGGCWTLEADGDGPARCTPAASADADLRMPVASLGALYVGGTRPRLLADAGLIDILRSGALDLADGMFRSPITPWCNTWF